ncbi:SDR family NAD(P)-dependent oxidoreductase [Nocardioides sp. WV_118_6]|uniref:SDR family NAD(P)-dependent oxidoreductase n=1 Tax=Nocardioides simplex TaxID=2045 RepID=UPI00214FCB30|nr:SDR family NAD(P)-dependent oxidoreductase [Pimelobacter simplex]UUW88125.1 SDR family NAD(P)-dependent oxidoreductase [Pimelobacter simplex]UUW97629.1 SDR family NAD(P)-dependent oxidoreductase [Pimelobacter simplex]
MRPWTQVPPQPGRRFVITGSNGGLGLETARILGSRGAEIVMACRSVDKGEAAARTVPGHDKGRVEVRQVDVSDLASVRAFAAGLREGGRPVDVLVNNAGVLGVPLGRSAEGVEMHLATNYLGHFLLTQELLPLLTDRVVMVSSREHRSGALDLDDLGWERRPYRPFQAYGDSKLADLLFMRELDRRFAAEGSPLRAVAAHPGASATKITGGSGNPVVTAIGYYGQKLVGMPAWRGALCTVYAATMDVPSGTYIGPHGVTELWGWPAPARMSPKADDPALAQALWERSVQLSST